MNAIVTKAYQHPLALNHAEALQRALNFAAFCQLRRTVQEFST